MMIISAVVLSTAVMLAITLNLTLKPERFGRLTTWFLAIGVVGGLIYYGAGLMEITGDLSLTAVRTPVMVLRMFLGVNEYSAIADTRLVSTHLGQIGFWLAHLFAFFSVASAALNSIGAETVRQLRFLLSHRGDLTLIYGINEQSIQLGKECLKNGKGAVVFLAESASAALMNDLNYAGMSVMAGLSAVSCDDRTMRKLHIGSRKLTVYALDAAEDKDLYFALRLKDALEKRKIPPENTRITLPGAEDIITSMLQVSEEGYGFGYVNVFDSSSLVARAMIRMCPPWESVRFGPDGRAVEDYSCVIVGFGSHGQAALKQLVMNSQFAGSTFHATVFSNNYEREVGYLRADSPELLKNYDIRSSEADARESDFYGYINNHLLSIKLIAICTGDEETNRELSDNLMLFLKRRRAENICVVRLGPTSVRYQESVGSPIRTYDIYTREFLSAEDADRNAILLNASYDNSDRTDWEKWVACDSFGKMSSRASADFAPAFIRASGSSREDLIAGKWEPSGEMLRNLGETEHLRWNAFHFSMGYRPMSREEFEANAETWARCKAEGVPCSIKIAKNGEKRLHACLVSWEELDELSARENELTQRNVDYKQMDINNVLTLPKLLQAEEKRKAEK
ncbi:MAG: hypothetical protein K6F56_11140 [Oscillospiraceae bacterium]|nr:hypothetical protein [Oscillospiraceae bacterium]